MEKLVIALGGNALQEGSGPATAEAQLAVVEKTSVFIADIIEKGYKVILAHGNGPQVGRIVLQSEHSVDVTPAMPFDVCGAMSQGMIGYHMQQGLTKALRARGNHTGVATVVTQVVVDKNDKAFLNPSKPIGPFYTEEEAKSAPAGEGLRRQGRRGPRLAARRRLPHAGGNRRAAGGAVPHQRRVRGRHRRRRRHSRRCGTRTAISAGTAAVIDKDPRFRAARGGSRRGRAAHSHRRRTGLPALRQAGRTAARPRQPSPRRSGTLRKGILRPAPCCPRFRQPSRFAKSKPGRRAIITSLDKAVEALQGKAGTTITL